jgi:membrane-bound lytic murein transglycosylase D
MKKRKRHDNGSAPGRAPALVVKIERGSASQDHFVFTQDFKIGRSHDCHIQFDDRVTSRTHAEIILKNNQWRVEDRQSANGTFVNGKKINRAPLTGETRIELGKEGPMLRATPGKTRRPPLPPTGLKKKKTMISSGAVMAALALLMGGIIVAAALSKQFSLNLIKDVKHEKKMRVETEQKQKKLAMSLFYDMKAIELNIASLKKELAHFKRSGGLARLNQSKNQLREMKAKYDRFLDETGVYKNMGEKERLILRVIRTFGESELSVPEGFLKEIQIYINKWRSTARLEKAIQRAAKNDYARPISREMLKRDIPPQFFYLALQESDFDPSKCGPETKSGIAKGLWQFIPNTAIQYGLKVGPLHQLRKTDPRDERHDFMKSTRAAAEFLNDIYRTEAQASGLLVTAAYNWGSGNVRKLIRQLPQNPRERNFWRFLQKYREKIPRETYDYVFYIISAATIGENPALFGFNFKNPLGEAKELL